MIKFIFSLIFRAFGWNFKNNVPDDLRSFVFIGAPHTSNFDIIPTLAVSHLMKRNAHFVIKKEWLKGPLGFFLKSVGAVGVDRNIAKESKTISYTDVMANLFKERSEFVLMISPEGTRSPNKHWKTGFYYIAQKAQVPIVLGYANYKTKEAGLGLVLYPQDFEKDMATIMDFYRTMEGKVQSNFLLDERFAPKKL